MEIGEFNEKNKAMMEDISTLHGKIIASIDIVFF